MDIKKDIKAFKNELRNYLTYKRKLDEINEKIELNDYEESGVKGIKYDTIKVSKSANEKAIAKKRLTLIERGEKLEAERDRLQKQINYIESILKQMDEKFARAIVFIYAEGRTYQDIVNSDMQYWTESDLFYQIEQELKKVFERTEKY